MAYTGVDEFGDHKREKSEEEVVKLYNERVHKVILAWKNLHGLFENIQNDNIIRPLIDQGNSAGNTSGDTELPGLDLEREKLEREEIKKRNQVMKETSEAQPKESLRDSVKMKLQDSAPRAGEEMKLSPVKVEERREDKRSIEKDDERKKPLPKMKELAEVDLAGLDRDIKSEVDELKKTAQVIKEISERKVKERAAAKVKLIGALASELGDEVKMLKDQLHQVKLEKKQLEEKGIQKDKYIRSLVDERKQLLSKVSKLSEELNALSAAHHIRSTAEAHRRPAGSQASASRLTTKQTTPTKQSHPSHHL